MLEGQSFTAGTSAHAALHRTTLWLLHSTGKAHYRSSTDAVQAHSAGTQYWRTVLAHSAGTQYWHTVLAHPASGEPAEWHSLHVPPHRCGAAAAKEGQ
jgi:hypothetical protein